VTQWTIYVDSSGHFGLSPTLGCASGATATRICNDISSAIAAAAAITPTHADLDTVDIIMAPGNYNSGCFTISLFNGKLIQYRFSARAKNLVQWNNPCSSPAALLSITIYTARNHSIEFYNLSISSQAAILKVQSQPTSLITDTRVWMRNCQASGSNVDSNDRAAFILGSAVAGSGYRLKSYNLTIQSSLLSKFNAVFRRFGLQRDNLLFPAVIYCTMISSKFENFASHLFLSQNHHFGVDMSLYPRSTLSFFNSEFTNCSGIVLDRYGIFQSIIVINTTFILDPSVNSRYFYNSGFYAKNSLVMLNVSLYAQNIFFLDDYLFYIVNANLTIQNMNLSGSPDHLLYMRLLKML
jgi:hypothetical protein